MEEAITHEEYIKRRDEMLDKNEDGWLSRSELQKAIDELVMHIITQQCNQARLDEALYIRYNAPDNISKDNWIGNRIGQLQSQGKK